MIIHFELDTTAIGAMDIMVLRNIADAFDDIHLPLSQKETEVVETVQKLGTPAPEEKPRAKKTAPEEKPKAKKPAPEPAPKPEPEAAESKAEDEDAARSEAMRLATKLISSGKAKGVREVLDELGEETVKGVSWDNLPTFVNSLKTLAE